MRARSCPVARGLAACWLAARGLAAGSPGVLHEAPPLPCGWRASSQSVAEGERVTLRLSLKQQGVARLQEAAERVSDPFSTSYGQHLTREQVEALVAPLPSDVAAVEGWLRGEGLLFSRPAVEVFEVALAARDAERLLRTRLGAFANSATGQRAVRAEDFMLPPEVDAAVAAVYGLHGLPLPPREAAAPPGPPAQAANVTPEVLATRYGISGVTPSGSVGNRQAVAEFQGQLIAQRDLDKFFADYVPSAAARSSKIYRYVGNKGTGPSGVESALDVDYIMGVAPGVLTEYWYWGGMDFCADLKNWTGTILASDSPPLVHSVSYGWQGNLSQVGCKPANVQDVDVNLMKLAARGITIVLASGDSGSGYTPRCDSASQLLDKAAKGKLKANTSVFSAEQCCHLMAMEGVKAWTFVPPAAEAAAPNPVPPKCDYTEGVGLEGARMESFLLPADIADHMCCDRAFYGQGHGVSLTCSSESGGSAEVAAQCNCTVFAEVTGSSRQAGARSSKVVPPARGQCLLFEEVSGTEPAKGSASGGAVSPVPPKMWPSWPASSPWVTAVGATRFVQQDVSAPEMATDQFGSGGGFSDMWPAFRSQAAVVEEYLRTAPGLPPSGSFPPGGRATPDVSALGEGYQVMIGGHVEPIGGTSASAPMFAALVSLLNEARLAAKKPPMGYMNPWIYAHPEAFTDVTLGTNAIGRGTGPLPFGFPCTKGWDPATGMGTPIFGKMLAAAMAVVEAPLEEIVV